MSRPRFLADHDFNEHIVSGVLRLEPLVDFLRVRDLGMSTLTDTEILEYAAREGLLVASHDVNTMPSAAFARLSAGESFPGLFMAPQSSPVASIIESLVMIWAVSELDEWKDQVIFLPLL